MRFLEVAKTKYIREGYSQFCVLNSTCKCNTR